MEPSYSAQIPRLRPGDMTNQSVLDRLTSHLNSLQLQAGNGINIRRQGSAGAVIEATAKSAAGGAAAGGASYEGFFTVTITGDYTVNVSAGRIIRKGAGDRLQVIGDPDPAQITGTGFDVPSASVGLGGTTGNGRYVIATIKHYFGGACPVTYRMSSSAPDPVFYGDTNTRSEERVIAFVKTDTTNGPFTEVIQQQHGEMVIITEDSAKYPFCIYVYNDASNIGVQTGTIICGSQTITKGYTPAAIPSIAGTYYFCLDVWYNSGWQSEITFTKTPPTTTSTHYILKLGQVIIADNKVVAIDQFVRGDVVLAGRWVD
jgi:hypothetical protein